MVGVTRTYQAGEMILAAHSGEHAQIVCSRIIDSDLHCERGTGSQTRLLRKNPVNQHGQAISCVRHLRYRRGD